jgi:hypothetical protein
LDDAVVMRSHARARIPEIALERKTVCACKASFSSALASIRLGLPETVDAFGIKWWTLADAGWMSKHALVARPAKRKQLLTRKKLEAL